MSVITAPAGTEEIIKSLEIPAVGALSGIAREIVPEVAVAVPEPEAIASIS